MKRMLLALSLALLVSISLSVSIANTSHSNGTGPKKDVVIGTANKWSSSSDHFVHFYAQSGPAGENPRGHFVVRGEVGLGGDFGSMPTDATGEVACLVVRDNRAFALGLVERDKKAESSARFSLAAFGLLIDDNGEGKEPNDKTTLFFFVQDNEHPEPIPPFPESCSGSSILDFFHPGAAITQGDFIVHDATP